jgi:glucokinase-like ROK family protein
MLDLTQKATQTQAKHHNKRLILKTIYDQEQISRADVARLTHLTRPTVSSTVAELIEEGLVAEIGQGPSAGGKPPVLLSIVDHSRYLIGIDIGSSQFRGGILDLRGRLIQQTALPVKDYHGGAALELVYRLIDQLLVLAPGPLLGIGIGSPGLMDARKGIVRKAVNLDWQDLPLRDLVETRYNLPVYLANDTHLAALAEYTFGNNRKSSNLIVIKAGRGISAGIVLNGQLYYGDGSGAGEIGHVMVVEDGEPCPCGHAGCLETVASSRAIIKQARMIAQNNPRSLLHRFAATPEAIDTQAVIEAFRAGDETLQQMIAGVGCYLGIAVANLVGVLNIHHIAIAGTLAHFGEPLLESTRREMKRRSMAILADETQVELSCLGPDIVIQGAVALLLSHELGLV